MERLVFIGTVPIRCCRGLGQSPENIPAYLNRVKLAQPGETESGSAGTQPDER